MPEDDDRARSAYGSFGAYLRSQRQLAQLTLRQLADLSSISNPYLSQIERGLHQPSVAVIRSIADALNLSADALLAQVAGLDEPESTGTPATTEAAIRADSRLTGAQKAALLSVYRSMVSHPEEAGSGPFAQTTEDAVPGSGKTEGADAAPPPAPTEGRAAARRSRSAPAEPAEPAEPAKRATRSRRPAAGRGTSGSGAAGQSG